MIWILASFVLSTLFSNEILMKLIFKPKLRIESFDQLNEHEYTALMYPGVVDRLQFPVR